MRKRCCTWLAALAIAVPSVSLHAGVRLYDLEGFVTACLASSSKLTRPVCECTAKKAAEALSPMGFQFLTATLRKDKEESLKLRSKLEPAELSTAGAFMSTGPAECGEELKRSQ